MNLLETTPEPEIERLADKVVQRVSEYDDRTSPEDWPEALLITGEELYRELMTFAADLLELAGRAALEEGQ